MPDGHTLWHGRFAAGPADALLAYTVSLPFDRRLWPDDITGSRAHVGGLQRAGLLTDDEATAILGALDQVEVELSSDTFAFVQSDEDIHTAVERRVTELASPAGGKLHTARSRNDQIATDLRLWCKRELIEVARLVVGLEDVLLARAEGAGDTYLPGYTHVQRAQPVLLAHHLLAHSLDAVSDRDFVAEALFDLAMVAVHLARLGEEWVLWTSEEFGFARLDDRYATGSSMLPQKKNPDIAELARGKSGRVIGDLTGFLATLKGLPLAYNRDLQEDKEPLFDALDQVGRALDALSGLLATVAFDTDRMQAAADGQHAAAVDLAEWLVERGVPFRDAHARVGA